MKKLIFSLLLILLMSVGIVTAEVDIELDITEYTLDNGLDVILVRDTSAPTAAVTLWYNVGGAHDPEGRSGFAHLFEHMMFQGSAHVEKGQLDTLITAVGGNTPNAYTSTERTVYFQTVPAHQLPLALWVEADRLASLDVTQTNLDNQRAVVIAELQQRVTNQPYGDAFQSLYTIPHDYAPYQQRVIGSIEDVNAATVDEIRAFHETYYLPNNATLVVAGDIDIETTRALIDEYFAPIPAGPEPPALPPYEMTQQPEAETFTFEDDLANNPAFLVAYQIPSRSHPDYPALELLSRILGGGNSSRLAIALDDTGLTAGTGSFAQDNRGPGIFTAYGFPNQGVELEAVEEAIYAVLDDIVENGIDEAELEKVINQITSSRIAGLETALNLAQTVQEGKFFYDDPMAVFNEINRFEAVTVEDIQTVIEEYLAPEDRHIIYVVPDENASPSEDIEPVVGASGEASDDAVDYRFVLEQDTPPEPLELREFTLPEYVEMELDNGLEVIVIQQDELPVLSLNLYLPGGESAVTQEQAGLAELTASLLTRGTETRSAQDIAATVEQVGGSIGAEAARDSMNASVFTLSEDADLAFDLLSDVVLNPTFSEDELELARSQWLTGLEFDLADPGEVASRTFFDLIYGEHPYGNKLMVDSLSALTRDDVVAFYESQRNPSGAMLLVTGDISSDDALAQAERVFGEWEAAGEPLTVSFPEVEAPEGTQVFLVDRPGSSQAEFLIGNPGVFGNDPDRYAGSVMNEIFGGSFSARLTKVVREELGYTYGIYSGFSYPVDRGVFLIGAAVRNEVAGDALQAILTEIDRLQTEGATPDELTRVKSNLTGSYALSLESASRLAGTIASFKLRDVPLENIENYPLLIEAVDADAVQNAAQTLIQDGNMVVVVVGDAEVIEAGLAEVAPVTLLDVE